MIWLDFNFLLVTGKPQRNKMGLIYMPLVYVKSMHLSFACTHMCILSNSFCIHLTLEPHRFELWGSIYTWIFLH